MNELFGTHGAVSIETSGLLEMSRFSIVVTPLNVLFVMVVILEIHADENEVWCKMSHNSTHPQLSNCTTARDDRFASQKSGRA